MGRLRDEAGAMWDGGRRRPNYRQSVNVRVLVVGRDTNFTLASTTTASNFALLIVIAVSPLLLSTGRYNIWSSLFLLSEK
jgi:hypothetical protein